MFKYKEMINSGKKIRGIAGFPEEVFPQLVGKTVAHGTQACYFNFKYTIEIDSIEDNEHSYTFYGKFNLESGTKISSHTTGKNCFVLYWIIE